MPKSIFGLELDELRKIVETGELPEDVDLDGMVTRADFPKVFSMRAKPGELASYLLNTKKEKPQRTATVQTHKYVGVIPQETRDEKLRLKRKELELREAKLQQSTTVLVKIEEMLITLNGINKRVAAMEQTLKRLVSLAIEREK